MTDNLGHLIGGQEVAVTPAYDSINPSNTDDVVARFPDGNEADVNAAVEAAKAAQPAWASASPELRSDVLDRVSQTIFARKDQLGRLLSREEGKTLAEGMGEVLRAARIFRYFSGEALRRHGQALESTRPGLDVTTHREALGVVGLITPWNFPIAIPAWKAAPALAFGNAVVIKPAGPTPAIAHALGKIIDEALATCGAPAGTFNMVLGPGRVGAAIAAHRDIAAVSFTGSQGVGAQVANTAVARQARVQLEMGGKNPLVVLDDADLDKAVACALDGAFFATGQRCTASSRIIVTKGIYAAFARLLAERADALRVGDALAADTQIGPAVSAEQLEQNLRYVGIARDEGGKVTAGGDAVSAATPGYYMRPTVISDTGIDMRINCEEVFGPVASLVVAEDYEEALDFANRGDFGLSAGICTSSLAHARDFRKRIRAGMVMINLPTAGVDYHVPFGGTKGSSYGPREQGFAAVEFYTQMKTCYVGS